jgi:hypothetical protein
MQTGRLNQQNGFSQDFGDWKSKTKVLAGLVSGENSVFGLQMAALSFVPTCLPSVHEHPWYLFVCLNFLLL